MKMMVLLLLSLLPITAPCQKIEINKIYPVNSAKQAVAVDTHYIYVINNTEILKLDKVTGEKVEAWKDDSGNIKHLNSGVIVDNKLYCAHSNFPETPMASSIEIFDPVRLQPIGSHSFGIDIGSATWIDWYDEHWYVVFAHYSGGGSEDGKTNQWTQLVKYTPDWLRVGGWIFPIDLIQKFGTYSNSGGFISSEGKIYATGHDQKELYVLAFPKQGYTLEWLATLPAPFQGQGIAKDPVDSDLFFGIARSQNQVISGYLVE